MVTAIILSLSVIASFVRQLADRTEAIRPHFWIATAYWPRDDKASKLFIHLFHGVFIATNTTENRLALFREFGGFL